MIKLLLNGRPFNPKTFEEQLIRAAMEAAAAELHEQVSSIRHPATGEFPTVVVEGSSLSDLSLRIEGSPELLQLVNERLGTTSFEESAVNESANKAPPKVFLSWGWEDRAMAESVAQRLMSKGIDTWWSEWCINAGDSLRQKIDEGLADCTHFVVLMTPTSINKPWVKEEMDAGFTLMLSEKKVQFIGLRYGLQVNQLPPLLRGRVSPEVHGLEDELTGLINDIHGVSKKPALGVAPAAVVQTAGLETGYSVSATAIARLFCEASDDAYWHSPQLEISEIASRLQLTEDDVKDALHELRNFFGGAMDTVWPEPELFATFDRFWKPWNPTDDALRIAADLVQVEGFPGITSEIAERYGWDARRLNPALAYLKNRQLVLASETVGCMPWLVYWIDKTDATRRFVRSRGSN